MDGREDEEEDKDGHNNVDNVCIVEPFKPHANATVTIAFDVVLSWICY